jgi:hypothetical protein
MAAESPDVLVRVASEADIVGEWLAEEGDRPAPRLPARPIDSIEGPFEPGWVILVPDSGTHMTHPVQSPFNAAVR